MRGRAGIDAKPLAEGAAAEAPAPAAHESEARYRSALKAGRMGSWETDFVAGTRTWSTEGLALFGIDLPDGRGTVGGDDDEYQRALHPDDRHLALDYRSRADHEDSFAADYRIVRPDGTQLWLSGRGLVVARQPDGRAHRLVSIMADVSERRRAEEHLLVERERLALALAAGQMGAYDLDIRRGRPLVVAADVLDLRRRPRELRADARVRDRSRPSRRPRRLPAPAHASDRTSRAVRGRAAHPGAAGKAAPGSRTAATRRTTMPAGRCATSAS